MTTKTAGLFRLQTLGTTKNNSIFRCSFQLFTAILFLYSKKKYAKSAAPAEKHDCNKIPIVSAPKECKHLHLVSSDEMKAKLLADS